MAFPNQSWTLIRLEFPAIFEVAARDRLLRVSFFAASQVQAVRITIQGWHRLAMEVGFGSGTTGMRRADDRVPWRQRATGSIHSGPPRAPKPGG